mgnify:CR=1 FL=1
MGSIQAILKAEEPSWLIMYSTVMIQHREHRLYLGIGVAEIIQCGNHDPDLKNDEYGPEEQPGEEYFKNLFHAGRPPFVKYGGNN